ncbi:MAG: hypothetical protein BMS9Abin37_2934 [Acidobacteriota bacterium]|nr:MAG: hypothetical protein BMS9Abin37_2934 [Acidobacteriota bacterium]
MHPQIVAALRRLQKERRTGVFKTTAERVRREVRFEAGAIVGAKSSSLDDRLGEVMVRRGRITQQELDDASKLVRSGRRLGDALVELEIVAREEVDLFVRAQLTEITSKILNEPPRKLEFRDEAEPGKLPGKIIDTPVPIADAIIVASRSASSSGDDVKQLLDETMVPVLAPEAYAVLESLSLQSQEAFVLSRCDGQSDVRGIFAQSPLSEEDTARILLGLEHAGIIEMKNLSTAGH